jgi:hypothetical protein
MITQIIFSQSVIANEVKQSDQIATSLRPLQ